MRPIVPGTGNIRPGPEPAPKTGSSETPAESSDVYDREAGPDNSHLLLIKGPPKRKIGKFHIK